MARPGKLSKGNQRWRTDATAGAASSGEDAGGGPATSSVVHFLGDTLVDSAGKEMPTSVLRGKWIALFFGADWVPPARKFRPLLQMLHAAMAEKAPGTFEVVFVSGDTTVEEFHQAMDGAPWLAVPFGTPWVREDGSPVVSEDGELFTLTDRLNSVFNVDGLPTLTILDPAGDIVRLDACDNVALDPEGRDFPWRILSLKEALATPAPLVSGSGPLPPVDKPLLAHEYNVLYFSAGWSAECGKVTVLLKAWYEAMKTAGTTDFEVIYVSSDREEDPFKEVVAGTPWPAIAFGSPVIRQLNRVLGVRGIPTLVVYKDDGTVVCSDATERFISEPEGFPWPRKAVEPLKNVVSDMNDRKVFILFLDKTTDADAAGKALLSFEVVAEEFSAEVAAAGQADEADTPLFAYALENDEWSESVREFSGLQFDKDGPGSIRLVLLNVPEGCKVLWPGEGAPEVEDIQDFVVLGNKGVLEPMGIKDLVSFPEEDAGPPMGSPLGLLARRPPPREDEEEVKAGEM